MYLFNQQPTDKKQQQTFNHHQKKGRENKRKQNAQ